MNARPAAVQFELEPLAAAPEARDRLRFITCGSVDDGKSTLIGRLLYDSSALLEDQLSALTRDSGKAPGGEREIDLALALDGLKAEREQGITIDVTYRYFATDRRSFIVADTPGHEQYTRNMATGASTADAAVLLVDARKGLSLQTRRHSLLVATLGIRHVILAVNKMDLVGWSDEVFSRVEGEYRAFAAALGFVSITAIPMAAKHGDNVTRRSDAMPWYRGPDLLTHLEELQIEPPGANGPFRLAVQWVNRPYSDFRGYAGLLSAGAVQVGQPVVIHPSGERTRVARIVTYDGDLPRAEAGQSVTLTLADEVDVSRGSVIAALDAPVAARSVIGARVFWMSREPLRPDATYLAKLGTATIPAVITSVLTRVDLTTLSAEEATGLAVNDVGDVLVRFDRPIPVDTFAANRDGGSFILIERESFDTVAMGLVLVASGGDRPAGDAQHGPATLSSIGHPDALVWLPSAFAAPWRSALKTASWRIVGTLLTVGAAWLLTGDLRIALLLGLFELSVKFGVHFLHERLWTRIGFGLSATWPSPPQPPPIAKGRP